ncbi:hypothetical protein ACFVW1_13980 [Streptomyces olivochromogenes]|uniref:hypothetical protein n=1 Tax=Streptomyces olivochromogenes TaxID=1963 RepID=UPI0036DE5045
MPRRDGRWRDHREAIDAIAFTFQTGTQWVHLPVRRTLPRSAPWPAFWAPAATNPSGPANTRPPRSRNAP